MELKIRIINLILRVEHHLCPIYCGVIDRHRVIAFLLLTLAEMFIIPFHLSLFIVLGEPWGLSLTVIHALILLGLQFAIWKRKLAFSIGISSVYLLLFSKLAIDTVFCSIFGCETDEVSIISNIFIMFILAITALTQQLKKTSLVIVIGMLPVISFFFARNNCMSTLFSVKAIFLGFILMTYAAIYQMKEITRNLRQPKRITNIEKKALDMIANMEDSKVDKTGSLMEHLTPELRERIINKATEHIRKEETDKILWNQVCEGFTNSEKQICKLVYEGKTLKEMCDLLNKSESNITSQRSHIRKKLNMDRKDDLRQVLEARISQIRETSPIS